MWVYGTEDSLMPGSCFFSVCVTDLLNEVMLASFSRGGNTWVEEVVCQSPHLALKRAE